MGLIDYQKEIYQNKIDHHFNVTNVEKEFLLLYGEVAEAFDAYKKNDNIGDELADVAIYLLGLSEILGIDLEAEIQRKMTINKKRKYSSNGNGYATKIE
ncbi:MazG-like family protein [Enterococcus mediterraneensis]|uniref:MazG-like family protein n=1 Tax=Enterococcus mediterraneensis TaxID=2364791 RepID=UPI000F04B6A6|nr:MazG-like family protein [Enterococcus mediterraneensis]